MAFTTTLDQHVRERQQLAAGAGRQAQEVAGLDRHPGQAGGGEFHRLAGAIDAALARAQQDGCARGIATRVLQTEAACMQGRSQRLRTGMGIDVEAIDAGGRLDHARTSFMSLSAKFRSV